MGERNRMLVAERSDGFCEWKLKNDFGSAICWLYTALFGFCHLMFVYMVNVKWYFCNRISFVLFWSFSRDVPVTGRVIPKTLTLCFSDSFVQIATVKLQVVTNFYRIVQKTVSIHPQNHLKSTLWGWDKVSNAMTALDSTQIVEITILLMRGIKELLQNLDAFCFNYSYVDCLYILLNYRFGGKVVFKSEKFFDIVQRIVHVNHWNRGLETMPSIAKKGMLRKKDKMICSAPSIRLKRRKLLDQSSQAELHNLHALNLKWNW